MKNKYITATICLLMTTMTYGNTNRIAAKMVSGKCIDQLTLFCLTGYSDHQNFSLNKNYNTYQYKKSMKPKIKESTALIPWSLLKFYLRDPESSLLNKYSSLVNDEKVSQMIHEIKKQENHANTLRVIKWTRGQVDEVSFLEHLVNPIKIKTDYHQTTWLRREGFGVRLKI